MTIDLFAGRLKELREKAGLTQGELAHRSGMTKDGIAQLEQGRRKPSWETVLSLCNALSIECTAFTEKATERQPQGRGRPPKSTPATPADELEQTEKRKRGRTKKAK